MAQLHKIVVGIDFGTTYSAAAWASTASPDHITLIGNWPTVGTRTHHSAPTEISYPGAHTGNTTDFQWGYDIPSTWLRLKWFKLLLETNDARVHSSMPLPQDMTPTDVARDYLSALYKHTMETLNRQNSKALMDTMKVEFVVTVPAVWSDAAKNRTRKAAETAGMGHHNLSLLSEPEAAAIYSIKIQDTGSIKVGNRIVVCDAGGGTVDLISYTVVALEPNLQVRECAVGTGEFAGSTYIDRNWETFLRSKLGEERYKSLSPETHQRIMRNFEEVKCAFEDRLEKDKFYVSIPTLGTVQEAERGLNVVHGEFEITREEIKSLFDPIVHQIIDLVSKQVYASSNGGNYTVSSVLLVGGFGESQYLFKRVRDWAALYNIETLQPRDAATAVVKGAVIRGLEKAMGQPSGNVVRLARRHYGTPMSTYFMEGVHNPDDAYTDPLTGKKMARNQISWFINKGDQLTDDKIISRPFTRSFRKYGGPWLDAMVACDLDRAPPRITPDVKSLCVITADLASVKKKSYERKWKNWRRYYTARYNLNMRILSGDMEFELIFDGASYGKCKVDFDAGLPAPAGSLPSKPSSSMFTRQRNVAEVPG
ncbi:hypothetical protein FPQ18DRAFT_343143 [Pyronema domesticum]|nr:hypothetical protein FPQ18DRAFT_343143 [Pyronema domesticum]